MRRGLTIKKSDIYVWLIVLFPVCNFIGGIANYYDEILGLVGLIYLLNKAIRRRIDKLERSIASILFVITIIGLVSNFSAGLVSNIFAVLVDVLWLWKLYAIFLLFRNYAKSLRINDVLKRLCSFSKCCIIVVSLLSIVGQFVEIGVIDNTKNSIMGLKAYGFFWQNAIQTGWLMFACLLLLSLSYQNTKVFYKYFLISVIPLALTFSSLVYCWLFVEVALIIMFREKSKFHMWYIGILAVGVGMFALNDINSYFLSDSVRMIFIRYAVITANTYFPLGSGFATYGSEMAARYYSPLYIKYGWENLWALGRTGKYLNDNFIASIIGQFGWIGFILYSLLVYILFRYFNTRTLNKIQRITAITTVITLAVVMIGSASAKSIMACCVLAILGLFDARMIENGR